ncbi:hypothetical protein GV829_04675 [Sphingomonas lacunae]|uniref:Uncharacterized protein n=1 Tax=Sphingomonas lacunae TaxID=2698828 RepID=A0A6M4ATT1_9SPHN|nr:hypothetical protein [Sphingomonas lacunae]QJQ31830.1 hypothetical protein GV829_04675 [Sphingomonas lacunae]
MTVPVSEPIATYSGDGTANPLSFPHRFLTVGDLRVTAIAADGGETVLTINIHYTVTGADNPAGGTVTPLAVRPSGTSWRIERVTPIEQPTDYVSGNAFPAESHERALDRLAMIAQDQARDVADIAARAPMVAFGETAPAIGEISDGQLLGQVAGKLVGINADVSGAAQYVADAAEQAGIATDQADLSLIRAAAALGGQEAAEDAAALAEQQVDLAEIQADRAASVALVNGCYPNAYAAAVPRGVTALAFVGGSGYTNGTHALVASGGPTDFAGTITVAGGAITAATILNPGLSTSGTAPTLTFPAAGAGTGGSVTATVGYRVPLGETYWAADASGRVANQWRNTAGSPVPVTSGGVQHSHSLRPMVEEALIAHTPLLNSAILSTRPELRRLKRLWMLDNSKEYAVQWFDRQTGLLRCRFAEVADPTKVYYAHLFGGNPNPSTDPGLNGGVGKVLVNVIGPTAGVIAGQALIDLDDGANYGPPSILTLSTTRLDPNALGFTAFEQQAILTVMNSGKPPDYGVFQPKATVTALNEFITWIGCDHVPASSRESLYVSQVILQRPGASTTWTARLTVSCERMGVIVGTFYTSIESATNPFLAGGYFPTNLSRMTLRIASLTGPAVNSGIEVHLRLDWTKMSGLANLTYTSYSQTGIHPRNVRTPRTVRAEARASTVEPYRTIFWGTGLDPVTPNVSGLTGYPSLLAAVQAQMFPGTTYDISNFEMFQMIAPGAPILFQCVVDGHVEDITYRNVPGRGLISDLIIPHGAIIRGLGMGNTVLRTDGGSDVRPVWERIFSSEVEDLTIYNRNAGGYVEHNDNQSERSKASGVGEKIQNFAITQIARRVEFKTDNATQSGVGMGISSDQLGRYEECVFKRTVSSTLPFFYSHGSVTTSNPTRKGRLEFINCRDESHPDCLNSIATAANAGQDTLPHELLVSGGTLRAITLASNWRRIGG